MAAPFRPRLDGKSRMSGDVHVRFREGVGVRLPRATRRNVYVKTKRAGERVFDSIEQFLWKRLKLRVNREKSAVAPCHERGFLGFGFTKGKMLKIKISLKALRGVKHRIKTISRRSRGISLEQMIHQLNTYLKGWMQYYRLVETSTVFPNP